MKRKWTVLAILMVCILVLTGCQCSHQWVEADCVTAKTCSKCEETEGEALGHDWLDATCEAPKTCRRCGLTEGEVLEHSWTEVSCAAPKTCEFCGLTEGDALEHTWVEANYQNPKTCSVCGGTEGEPWTAAFEENGFAIDITEVGVPYPAAYQEIPFEICITSYEIYESDETHEAKEGYAWRTITYTLEAMENQSYLNGLLTYTDYSNYYEMETFLSSMKQLPGDALLSAMHTINYNGEDAEYLFQLEDSFLDNSDGKWILKETLSFQVPTGFDGVVLCIGDVTQIKGNYADLYMDFYAHEDTVFFRLK